MPEEKEEELTKDRLCSWDRPSVLMAGMAVATALQKVDAAVFMVDVLGRVQLMSPGSIQVLHRPRLRDAELDLYSEEQAIQWMVLEGRKDGEMRDYLAGRDRRVHA